MTPDTITPAAITEASTSRYVQTAKWRLHYNEAGSGHPIIMLHGMGPGATGWSNFSPNVAALSHHFRVILLDFPGWGKSDAFDCSSTPRLVENAEAVKLLMDELGIEKAALVGNSMGGGTVLQFMTAYPDRISHAVTMGAGLFTLPSGFTPTGFSEGLRVIMETYANPSPENFRRLISVMVFDSSFITDALVQERSAGALENREHLLNALKAPMGNTGGPFAGVEKLMSALSQSTVPTLMVHGRDDRVIPLEVSLRTAALIPNCRVTILNRCGHWAQLEQAAEFNAMLVSFLGNAGGTSAIGG